jgi:hypothetical protein
MVAKAFAMLGLIRRLSLEFRDPYIRKLRVEPVLLCSVYRVECVQRQRTI